MFSDPQNPPGGGYNPVYEKEVKQGQQNIRVKFLQMWNIDFRIKS